jgi:hypothetical protein
MAASFHFQFIIEQPRYNLKTYTPDNNSVVKQSMDEFGYI